jgi:RHS repeat-associated protein
MRLPMVSRLAALSATIALALCAGPVTGASTSIYAESGKLMRSQQGMATLGPELFGDRINLYTGAVEFVHTDVSLPGNSALPVAVGRRLETGAWVDAVKPFGNWDLEIPRLHGVFSNIAKWTKAATPIGSRCTGFGEPPTVSGSSGSNSAWSGLEYWHGNFLYVPGSGDQEILQRNAAVASTTAPLITTGLWTLACGVALQGTAGLPLNEAGEGFLATSPDGTKYRFDWMAARGMTELEKSSSAPESFATIQASGTTTAKPPSTPNAVGGNVLARVEVWIMPTLVTDRYGNTVTYSYDTTKRWQLKTIVGNDGRTITLSWTGDKITSVNDGTRTWTYAYSGDTLVEVTQPDSSRWQLGAMAALQRSINYLNDGGCDAQPWYDSAPATASMVHPSGATGTFTLAPVTHGRSFVFKDCLDALTQSPHLRYPAYFDTLALKSKTLSGPGVPALSWQYHYGPPNASFDDVAAQLCLDSKIVNVADPDGNVTRYTFGNRFRENEGKMLKVESGLSDLTANSGGTPLRTVYMSYRGRSAAANYPQPFGYSLQPRGNGLLASHLAPMDEKVTVQQDVSFVWKVEPSLGDFDSLGRPLGITRSSSLGYTRSEKTTYYDNTTKWVLGQVATVTEPVSGRQMVTNTYNATTANPAARKRFGLQYESYTFNANGTLATKLDGKSNTITYGSYKLGIPLSVSYPDAATEAAVVDNFGLISSTTDQAGFISSYTYDAMGRLASITYPTGDTPAWLPTTQSFQQTSADFGINGAHWVHRTTTGNQVQEIHFDALLRPVVTRQYDAADPGATNKITVRRYDAEGKVVFESYPQRYVGSFDGSIPGVQTQYDALDRVTSTSADSEHGALVTTHSYDSGFRHRVRNPRQYETLSEYFALDEPDEKSPARITLANGTLIDITRDIFGSTTAITRSGQGRSVTRNYVYDTYQRVCKTIEPETGATVLTYDTASNVLTRAPGQNLPDPATCTGTVAAAGKISFTYDAMNRLKNTSFGDGSPAITRTYTPDGLPLNFTSNGAVWVYTYNKRRLLSKERLTYSSANYDLSRTYNADTSLAALTYPDNSVVPFAPNALNEPSQVGSYASTISYHPNGAVAGFTYGNGIVHSMVQNERGLPEQVGDSGVLNDLYSYDENGNVSGITDQQESISTRSMGYDEADRLISVNAPNLWGNASYSYDALDNLTGSSLGGATGRSTTHQFDSATNRLTGISSGSSAYNLSYSYDVRGNITQRGTQAYVFDVGNRMSSATGKATYTYDGHGRRVKVVESNGTSRIQVYDQAGQLRYAVQTGGPNPAVTTKYIYLNRHMLAEVAGTTVQYSHSDALGSPVARTSAAGTVLTRTRYEPYGMTAAGTNPSGIGFTGHVNDTNTGLVYMQQRYYDPVAGRLLSIDPVVTDAVTGDSFNRYAYANNNPHRYTDPDGRDAAEKFVEQHRKDVESGKGATYKPLLPVAAAIGAPYAIATVIVGGPAIATATVATIKSLAPSAAKITTEVASKTETVLTNPKNLIPTQSQVRNDRFTGDTTRQRYEAERL